jgi:hypothetical protein
MKNYEKIALLCFIFILIVAWIGAFTEGPLSDYIKLMWKMENEQKFKLFHNIFGR